MPNLSAHSSSTKANGRTGPWAGIRIEPFAWPRKWRRQASVLGPSSRACCTSPRLKASCGTWSRCAFILMPCRKPMPHCWSLPDHIGWAGFRKRKWLLSSSRAKSLRASPRGETSGFIPRSFFTHRTLPPSRCIAGCCKSITRPWLYPTALSGPESETPATTSRPSLHQHQRIECDNAFAHGMQDHRVEVDLADRGFGAQDLTDLYDQRRERRHIQGG